MRALVVLTVVLAGFLPVVTLRSKPVRVACGLFAGLSGAYFAVAYLAASAPDAGLPALIWAMGAAQALSWSAGLLWVGVAGALARGLARMRRRPTPWQITFALAAIPLALVFVVPPAADRLGAEKLYAKNQASVAVARDAAPAQSKTMLVKRVTDALATSVRSPGERGLALATDRLVELWHPGVTSNARVWGDTPVDAWRYSLPPSVQRATNSELSLYYRVNDPGQTWGVSSLGPITDRDSFAAAWMGEIDFTRIERESLSLLVFFEDKKGHPPDYGNGTPLFPEGTFHRLDISRIRGTTTTSFLTLYAVNDRGRWWLVGIDNPNAE